MNTLAVPAALLASAVVTPHLLPLDRVRPVGAATVWGTALVARAVLAVGAALTAVICMPDTPRLARWLRELPHQLIAGVEDTELLLVGLTFLAVAATVRRLWACLSGARAPAHPLPLPGPGGSIVVGDREVLLAAVGWRHRAIVVSAGALAALDDDESAAGLAHEQGHISRAHHWWQAGAEVCRLLAGWLPGTARAGDELSFHLERDADVWAVDHAHDPLVLASAVCKAALAAPVGTVAAPHRLIGRSPAYAGRRIRLLLEGCPTGTRRRNAAVRAGALTMAGLVVGTTLVGTAHFGTTLVRCHITDACTHPARFAHPRQAPSGGAAPPRSGGQGPGAPGDAYEPASSGSPREIVAHTSSSPANGRLPHSNASASTSRSPRPHSRSQTDRSQSDSSGAASVGIESSNPAHALGAGALRCSGNARGPSEAPDTADPLARDSRLGRACRLRTATCMDSASSRTSRSIVGPLP